MSLSLMGSKGFDGDDMKKVHIVSHTHWDREWYRPYEYFRSKLVFVIDRLLSILETDSSYLHFLLDGQTLPLEDYLEIRPENTQLLTEHIRSGRIIVGPWYIQPDEFAPDGESLIRNLQIGMKIAEKFGEPMLIGYLPDSFGHSGQMPHILKGFGIDSAVVMRGFPAQKVQSSEFIWEADNGDEVFTVYLPFGYSNAMFMPEDFGAFKIRMKLLIQQLKKWVSTDNFLAMNGVDHQFPQAHIPDFIERLNKSQKQTQYLHSTLQTYINEVKQNKDDFQHVAGELISPVAHRVHTSIASTRIYQKQKNRKMETLLENYVEPTAAIAWMFNADYPRGLIEQAWKYLIQNQTHDGICGCCLDEVHKEMDQRFANSRIIGETLLESCSRAIAESITPDQLTLTVFNNAMVQGRQFVHAAVYVKKEKFTLEDLDGNILPYQIEHIEEVDVSQFDIWTLYMGSKQVMKKVDIGFFVDFESNIGFKIFRINEKAGKQDTHRELTVNGNIIENRFFTIEINKNGSINLFDKTLSARFTQLHFFEDCGDAGDTYNFSPVSQDTVITSQDVAASFEVDQIGKNWLTMKINLALDLPRSLSPGDQTRSEETIPLSITSWMTIYSDIKRIDFKTEIDNTAHDHRLRVLFPTGIHSDCSYAQNQFGIIKRPNQIEADNWKQSGWKEKPLPIYAQHKFVAISDGEKGFAVLNRGLPEYEIYKDSTIAVTLVRSIGMMGKPNLLIRPGRPSGMPIATPDAQCQRKIVLEYALLSHDGCVYSSPVSRAAEMYNAAPFSIQNPIRRERVISKDKLVNQFGSIETLTSHIRSQMDGVKMSDLNILKVQDETLIISAFKKAEGDEALIVRLYNPDVQPVCDVQLVFGIDIRAGCLTDFNEKKLESLKQTDSRVFVLPEVRPHTAVTMKFLLGSID